MVFVIAPDGTKTEVATKTVSGSAANKAAKSSDRSSTGFTPKTDEEGRTVTTLGGVTATVPKTGIQSFVEDTTAGKIISSPLTTAGLAAVLTGGLAVPFLGAATVIKLGLGIGFSVASGSGIMTWLASDNILSSMSIFTRDLRQAVTFGQISKGEAKVEMDKAQEFVDTANNFINVNTAVNPLLWPFRGIILTNVQAAQNTVDYNRRTIAAITPVGETDSTNPEGSGKTDEEWADIFDENEQRKQDERDQEILWQEEDDARWQRIRDENDDAKAQGILDDATARDMEDEYWAGVDARKIQRDTANKLAEGAYWAGIQSGMSTSDAIRAGETVRANFMATGELPDAQGGTPTGQPATTTEEPLTTEETTEETTQETTTPTVPVEKEPEPLTENELNQQKSDTFLEGLEGNTRKLNTFSTDPASGNVRTSTGVPVPGGGTIDKFTRPDGSVFNVSIPAKKKNND